MVGIKFGGPEGEPIRTNGEGMLVVPANLDGKVANGEIKGRPLGVVRVREMDFGSESEMQTVINYWKDDRNRFHFATPPRTIEELQREASKPQNHFLVATVLDKESVGQGGMLFPEGKIIERIVGAAQVQDNTEVNQNDHWIGLVVINPDRQGQGLGKRVLLETMEWAFGNQTFDRRPRLKLDISVMLDADEIRGFSGGEKVKYIGKDGKENEMIVPSGKEALEHEDEEAVWAILAKFQQERRESVRMITLTDFFDFRHKSIFFEEIAVPNKTESQPTARFELTLRRWRKKLEKKTFRKKINSLRQVA